MVNSKHELTVDDLIVEYMMYKVKNNYEPSFSVSEFMDFLKFFQSKMEVKDVLEDGKKLFDRFFRRKNKEDWFGWEDCEPHMDMSFDETKGENVIRANYRLSNYDRSEINTYFMDETKVEEIRSIISEYVDKQPKRRINEYLTPTEDIVKLSKLLSAQIIIDIWDIYLEKLVRVKEWPSQCRDINEYLLETDLAQIIKIPSVREELLELYHTYAHRIALMAAEDPNLRISPCTGSYLEKANYDLLIKDYEEIMKGNFGVYKNTFDIDLEKTRKLNGKEGSETKRFVEFMNNLEKGKEKKLEIVNNNK